MADTLQYREAQRANQSFLRASTGERVDVNVKVIKGEKRELAAGGPEWLEDARQHIEEHYESALRMVGDKEGADLVKARREGVELQKAIEEEQAIKRRAHSSVGRLSLFGDLSFETGRDLRDSMDKVNRMCVLGATELGVIGEVVEELLTEVAIVKKTKLGALVPKAVRRRRARKVSRPIKDAAECMRHAAAHAKLAPTQLNREYGAEMQAAGRVIPGKPVFEF
ncbi:MULTISPECIES: hypothetical protein [Streptomyces]|uniref:hypothetical protein n=1 Tax=Streptomyces TaxID=1883 RepID=UPI0004CD56DD|nr:MULTISPECIES: hypothetical protein [Streptomyces]